MEYLLNNRASDDYPYMNGQEGRTITVADKSKSCGRILAPRKGIVLLDNGLGTNIMTTSLVTGYRNMKLDGGKGSESAERSGRYVESRPKAAWRLHCNDDIFM